MTEAVILLHFTDIEIMEFYESLHFSKNKGKEYILT